MKRLMAIAMATLTLAAASGNAAENRYVRVINRSSDAIRYLYASNVDRSTWEWDLLGPGRVVWPNQYIDANMDDRSGHCYYDIKVVLWDKREAIWSNFNVCTQSSVTVTD